MTLLIIVADGTVYPPLQENDLVIKIEKAYLIKLEKWSIHRNVAFAFFISNKLFM